MRISRFFPAAFEITSTLACDSCYGPSQVIHERHVRRMQPGAGPALSGPGKLLEWGQLNFIHTTDTHGWLEGHIKEQNYGADWGDFVSFQRHMKRKASRLGVDLLTVDTGDLHDGNGLSDASSPNGVLSNPVLANVDFDLLTIGNHELYVSEIAYETFSSFSKQFGDKYLTSNVQILNPLTARYEYIGKQYRYFTTPHGLRIMSFGILFDFEGNSNVTKITNVVELVNSQWFHDAVNFTHPIDLFVVIGHNPVRPSDPASTLGVVYAFIRSLQPNIPIQILGGHTHIRDFVVYDDMSTGIESGRYCETVGWLAMSGINSSSWTGKTKPRGVPNPTRKASNSSQSGLVYARRYLDWNRRTFAYHAINSQDNTFDYHSGLRVTNKIAGIRKQLNLSTLYGCAPETLCISCKPFREKGSIFGLLATVLGTTVINPSRSSIPRLIIINTGGIRYDLVKGPFTYDDSFIVSPFTNKFRYLPKVPYTLAKQVLDIINNVTPNKKRAFDSMTLSQTPEICTNPSITHSSHGLRSLPPQRRQIVVTPGYTTTDDFGTDGDDTPHSTIPAYPIMRYIQGNGTFPTDGTDPESVDLVFAEFFQNSVVDTLNGLGGSYKLVDVNDYMREGFTLQSYLPLYAKQFWQNGMPNCPVGQGVGFDT